MKVKAGKINNAKQFLNVVGLSAAALLQSLYLHIDYNYTGFKHRQWQIQRFAQRTHHGYR